MARTIGFPAIWLPQKEKLGRSFKLKSFIKSSCFQNLSSHNPVTWE